MSRVGPGGALMRRRPAEPPRARLAAGATALAAPPGCAAAPGGLHIAGRFDGVHPSSAAIGCASRSGARRAGAPARRRFAVRRRVHTVIAGGGVAGLAAARALRLRASTTSPCWSWKTAPAATAAAGQVGGIACPLGAHYLPVPGDDAHEVQDLLEELGLRQRVAGRWQYDERHLCHSPQERLFFNGEWQEGLLPVQGVGAARWPSTGALPNGCALQPAGALCNAGLQGKNRPPPPTWRWTLSPSGLAGPRGPERPAPALVPGLLLPRRLRRRAWPASRPGPASTTSPAATAFMRRATTRANATAC
jgi:hypothetical protein